MPQSPQVRYAWRTTRPPRKCRRSGATTSLVPLTGHPVPRRHHAAGQDHDGRKTNPRFTGDNCYRNLALVDEVTAIGAEIGANPAQTALVWLPTRGDDIAPIPGTHRIARVEEKTAAADIRLRSDQLQRLDSLKPAAGERHDQAKMARWTADTI